MIGKLTVPPEALGYLIARRPFLWTNANWLPVQEASAECAYGMHHVYDAEDRFRRFAKLLQSLFPELAHDGGLIDSPLCSADSLKGVLLGEEPMSGHWFIKCDHALPVAGSIKARGGIYEVLMHAESLARSEGLIGPDGDPMILTSKEGRALFGRHQVAVGSTGNLGLSVGIAAAALGFQAVVHMSSDAKGWKKDRLRRRGVRVVEHQGDFGWAVAEGRLAAQGDPHTYFVDDERSERLFFGYSAAALDLHRQLIANRVRLDARHPLFVYLPCGVGGAPSGITFGLRRLLGDHVHCFFAEPTASPCMLVRLASQEDRPVSIRELGLDNATEADGLAVAQASEFSVRLVRKLVSGVFTVPDHHLLADLYQLGQRLGMRIEPSAAAAFRGPRWILRSEAGREYLQRHGISNHMDDATHVLWTTGGAFVPEEDYESFYERGRLIAQKGT